MKVLILGANGQVGLSLINYCKKKFIEYKATSRKELDITNKSMVEDFFASNHNFDFVLNAAAYTAVDKAENEAKLVFLANGAAPKYLAESCKKYVIPLLHLSTDYVFNGDKQTPYKESDAPLPINTYGSSKLQGEEYIEQTWEKHIILRVSWVFSEIGHNFVKSILKLGQEKEILKVVADQFGSPTAAAHIAAVIMTICQEQLRLQQSADKKWGIYHYVDFPTTTWHQLAVYILKKAKQKGFPIITKSIIPISSADYVTVAKRPYNSALDVNKLEATFNVEQYSWQQWVDCVLNKLIKRDLK